MRARLTIAVLAAFAFTNIGVVLPVAAQTDPTLCESNPARGVVPNGFNLRACVSDSQVIIANNTKDVVIWIDGTGDVNGGRRDPDGIPSSLSAGLMALENPVNDFANTGRILLPPHYKATVSFGLGAANVAVSGDSTLQNTYLWMRQIELVLGGPLMVGKFYNILAGLINELTDINNQYETCNDGANAFHKVLCASLLSRNVSFAYGRAVVKGLTPGLVGLFIGIVKSASLWLNAAEGIESLGNIPPIPIAAFPTPSSPPPRTADPNRIRQAQHYANVSAGALFLGEDGVAGPATIQAFKDFQGQHGLAATGALDDATFDALAAAAADNTYGVQCFTELVNKPGGFSLGCLAASWSATDLVWEAWTADKAVATGTLGYYLCDPDCPSSEYVQHSMRLEFTNPELGRCGNVFTSYTYFDLDDNTSQADDNPGMSQDFFSCPEGD